MQEDQIVQGIREHSNNNIDFVTNLYRAKASAEYGKKLVDIEAAMLSKHSTAVKNYLDEKIKKIERRKQWPQNLGNKIETKDRKKNHNNKPTLGERSKE